MVRRRLLAMRQLMPWYSQASPVRPSSAVGALHRRRDGLDPRRRCDSRHRSESLGCLKCSRRGWHSAPRKKALELKASKKNIKFQLKNLLNNLPQELIFCIKNYVIDNKVLNNLLLLNIELKTVIPKRYESMGLWSMVDHYNYKRY